MSDENDVAILREELTALRREVGMLQDEKAIRELQYKYGYYLDKCLYDEVIDLFANDAQATFLNGVYSRQGEHSPTDDLVS